MRLDGAVVGIECSSLDEQARASLRPLIDAGVLVTYRDDASGAVRVTFAGASVPAESDRLRDFIGSNAEFLAWRERLHARASLWRLAGQPSELLLPEEDTRAALRWKADKQRELASVELAFIDESLKSQRGFAAATRTAAAAAAPVPAPVMEAPVTEAPVVAAPVIEAPVSPPPTVAPIPLPTARTEQLQPARLETAAPAPKSRWVGRLLALAAVAAVLLVGVWYFARPMPQALAPPAQVAGSPEERARVALSEYRYGDAVQLYTEAIDAGKPLLAERAYAHRLAGDLRAALRDYDAAIMKGGAADQVYSDAAYTVTLMGKPHQAVGYLTKGLHKSPSNARLYVDRANAYMTLKEYRSALTDFENARQLDPTSPAAQAGRVAALSQLKLPTGTSDLLPRLYIHIASEVQRDIARVVQGDLRDLGYQTPGIQFMDARQLKQHELRYVFDEDRPQAERLALDLQKLGVAVSVVQVQDKGSKVRPRHFELWFAPPGEGSEQKATPVQQRRMAL